MASGSKKIYKKYVSGEKRGMIEEKILKKNMKQKKKMVKKKNRKMSIWCKNIKILQYKNINQKGIKMNYLIQSVI